MFSWEEKYQSKKDNSFFPLLTFLFFVGERNVLKLREFQ
jgi:hypothetical protein